MAINDDDITTSGAGGEGPADGGSNPEGHDGGADGTAAAKAPLTAAPTPKVTTAVPTEPRAAKDPPTAAPTPKVTTAEPTEPLERLSMLSRCVAADPRRSPANTGVESRCSAGRCATPRLLRLLSSDTVDELIAERGVRAPFIRLAKEGDVLARDCYLGPAGFGAEIPDQVDSAKVLGQFASGATIVLQGLHRLWPPLIDFVRQAVDDLGHPVQANAYITPPTNRGFDPHYDVHDVFVLQVSGQKRWIVHEPVLDHPLPSQPWTQHRTAIAERVAGEPVIDTVLSEGDALYLPRGWVHSAQALETTSIHLTIGVSALTGVDVARAVVDQLATRRDSGSRCRWAPTRPNQDEIIATVSKAMAEMVERCGTRRPFSAAAPRVTVDAATRRAHPARLDPAAGLAAGRRAGRHCEVQWRHGLVATLDAGRTRRAAAARQGA